MILSARAAVVDYLRETPNITSFVDAQNIQDIDYEFEDFYNASGNNFSFPAVSVQTSFMNFNNQINCQAVNLYTETLDVSIYNQVNTSHLRGAQSVRNQAELEKRKIDSVRATIQSELLLLDGSYGNLINICKVEITNTSDSVFNTEDNSKIYQSFFSVNITYKSI